MLKSTLLNISLELVWAIVGMNCLRWTKIAIIETYNNKLCSANFVEFDILAISLLKCLAICAPNSYCVGAIYHGTSKRCYNIRDGFRPNDWSTELVGAKWYRKGSVPAPCSVAERKCPVGWVFIHQSCYKLTTKETERDESMNICKNFFETAHLADYQSSSEALAVKHEIGKTAFGPTNLSNFWKTYFWTGMRMTEHGYVLSNGETAAWLGNSGQRSVLPGNDTCIKVLIPFHNFLYEERCNARHMGMCELDCF